MEIPVANATWSPVSTPLGVKGFLKFLIASSSLQSVHSALQEIIQEEYSFLQTLFPSGQSPTAQGIQRQPPPPQETQRQSSIPAESQEPQVTQQPQEPTSEDLTSNSRIRSDRKIRVVKKSGLTDLEVEQVSPESTQEEAKDPPFTSFLASPEDNKTKEDSKFRNPKDVKKWQKEQEEAKHAELVKEGVDPKTLLTKENLQRWVEVEGKGYAQIARDHVGLSEEFISALAKSYGIQSAAAKRRAAVILAQKRKGGRG
jgi:hypothetical protein